MFCDGQCRLLKLDQEGYRLIGPQLAKPDMRKGFGLAADGTPLTLASCKKIGHLGSGAFGKVTVVESNGFTYALKAQSKYGIEQEGLQRKVPG